MKHATIRHRRVVSLRNHFVCASRAHADASFDFPLMRKQNQRERARKKNPHAHIILFPPAGATTQAVSGHDVVQTVRVCTM